MKNEIHFYNGNKKRKIFFNRILGYKNILNIYMYIQLISQYMYLLLNIYQNFAKMELLICMFEQIHFYLTIRMLQMTEAVKLFSFKINGAFYKHSNALCFQQRYFHLLCEKLSTFRTKAKQSLSKYSINRIVYMGRKCPFAFLIAKTGQVWTKTFTNTTKCTLL